MNANKRLVPALLRGDLEEVRTALAAGADPNAPFRKSDFRLYMALNVEPYPLFHCIVSNTVNTDAMIALLCEHGANLDLQDGRGWSALMLAVQYGREDAALSLVRHGADLYLSDHKGVSVAQLVGGSLDTEGASLYRALVSVYEERQLRQQLRASKKHDEDAGLGL